MLSRVISRATRNFSTSSVRAADLAKFTAIGRVGTELTPSESSNGTPYLRYAIAVNTKKDETSWFNIVSFDPRQIEYLATYAKKGSLVYVEADASVSQFESEDGRKISSLQLVQKSVQFVGNRKKPEDEDAETDEV